MAERKLQGGQFYGQILSRREFGGFFLSETVYPPRLEIPKHSHRYAYFCFVGRGAFTERFGNRTRHCVTSTLVLHPAHETHSDCFHEFGAQCLNIQLKPSWPPRAREHGIALNAPLDFGRGELTTLATKLYSEYRHGGEASALIIEGLVLEIIGRASRQSLGACGKEPPRWLKQAREIIHAHFSDPLSLTQIAWRVEAHPVHLARAFRRHYRCTVGEYLRQVRTEFACRQLSSSSTPLAQVAASAGFADQSHFCKTFKRLTGRTPSEFREDSRSR